MCRIQAMLLGTHIWWKNNLDLTVREIHLVRNVLREVPASIAHVWGEPAAEISCYRKRFGETVIEKSVSLNKDRGVLSPTSLVLHTPNGTKAEVARKQAPPPPWADCISWLLWIFICNAIDLAPSLLCSEAPDDSAFWKHYEILINILKHTV